MADLTVSRGGPLSGKNVLTTEISGNAIKLRFFTGLKLYFEKLCKKFAKTFFVLKRGLALQHFLHNQERKFFYTFNNKPSGYKLKTEPIDHLEGGTPRQVDQKGSCLR